MDNFKSGSFTSPSGDKVITSPGCSIGSSDTQVANIAFKYMIDGLVYSKAAVAAGTAVTATAVPIATYGLFAFEIDAAGTIAGIDAAGNATGYASAGAALAAMPTATAGSVIFMYIIVLADTGTWTGATDDLIAGSDLTSVSFLNSTIEPGEDVSLGFVPSLVEIWNPANGCVMEYQSDFTDGYAKTNKFSAAQIITPAGAKIGTTDTKVGNVQFEYYSGGEIKTVLASAAGQTLAATTVPLTKFGLFGWEVNKAGTIAAKDASGNAAGTYATAAAALAALPTATAESVLFMYIVVEADSGNFVGATDDLVAGSDITAVDFYSVAGDAFEKVHGVTPLDNTVTRGFRIGYYSELVKPGETIYYKAWR